MVKVLAIADEEAPILAPVLLRELSPDLVLSAGDLPWHYLEYVASATDAPLVWVPGNHDPEADEEWLFPADGTVVDVGGLRIAGLGGCVRYRPGPNQYTQREYRRRARRLLRAARKAGPVDVLLTHAPPAGLGDGEDGPHQGIEVLHEVIDRLQPRWHLHGHIHPYGQPRPDRQVGGTTIRNVIPWDVLEIGP